MNPMQLVIKIQVTKSASTTSLTVITSASASITSVDVMVSDSAPTTSVDAAFTAFY